MDTKEAGRKGGRASWEKLTPEQRAEKVRKAGLARVGKLTPEQRSELARKAGRAPRKARTKKAALVELKTKLP